ncbi:hypothetical protein BKA82DRAFT_4355879 [Pisolithus tinctorius]|nr:hypothetical protein BKA82DRAFT_4355879 [Pisolithus tinctorius]
MTTSATPHLLSQVVDEDYDEGVTDTLVNLSQTCPAEQLASAHDNYNVMRHSPMLSNASRHTVNLLCDATPHHRSTSSSNGPSPASSGVSSLKRLLSPTTEETDMGHKYVNSIVANGGENNPQVMVKIQPLKEALTEPFPPSDVGLKEWHKHQAQAIGCTINQVPLGHVPLWADYQQIISAFASAAFIYDLLYCPHGVASTVRGNPPAKDSEPKEGEMTDDLFKDKDRLQM